MSQALPDVVGLPLAEAERPLAAAGTLYEVRKTYPRPTHPDRLRLGSKWRVIQQRPAEPGVVLVVAQSLASAQEDDEG